MSNENGQRQNKDVKALRGYHRALLEAMRQREVDIIKFLAILGLALGGFVWLYHQTGGKATPAMIVGLYGVLLSLFVGALYALALGYNYRSITMQAAKLECGLRIQENVLLGWPTTCRDFERRFRWGAIPWSSPPEIIKTFWLALLLCIFLVIVFSFRMEPDVSDTLRGNVEANAGKAVGEEVHGCYTKTHIRSGRTNTVPGCRFGRKPFSLSKTQWILLKGAPWVGLTFLIIAGAGPVWTGRRLLRLCREELRYGECNGWGEAGR